MRVVLFMDAPRIGGAERYFADLCEGLAAAGVEVHAVSTEGGVLLPWLEGRLEGVELHAVAERPPFDESFARNVVRGLRPFLDIGALLRRLQADVVHLSNGGYPGSHMCRSATFATRGPRVMTVNCAAQPRRAAGGRSVYAVLDPLVWRSLDAVICPAEATARSLETERGAPAELMRVINYGIPAPSPDPGEVRRARAELAPGGELLVGMVAAPSTADDIGFKGHDVLLDAVAAVSEPLRVAIVGHDPGDGYRARARELGVEDRLVFLPGFRDAAPLMEAFDVLAVPSTRNEALPLVILEAMAAGTPVFASRLSGIPEAVIDDRSGFTLEPGDSAALARLLGRATREPELVAKLGVGARALWRERFSVERMVAATLDVYEQALAAGGKRSSAGRRGVAAAAPQADG